MIDIFSPSGGRPNFGPVSIGEIREFRLDGDGPFMVSSKCFVDKPSPPGPGFVNCPECQSTTVKKGDTFSVAASLEMWGRVTSGKITVRIMDRNRGVEEFNLTVQTDIGGTFNSGTVAMS